MGFRIITPPRASDGVIAAGLVSLTEAIAAIMPDTVSHGLLGGRFGYGARYENDVFMMHPYCWCERPECPWCRECECELEPAPSYAVAKECENCKNPKELAPNFHHKKTGLKVWWYKWIGRGMEIQAPPKIDPHMVFSECLASIGARP